MPTVSRFSIAPVKALGLQHPEELAIERYGARGDRAFYLIDREGRLFTGSKHGPLVRIRVDHDESAHRLTLTFPDGSEVDGFTEAMGEPVMTDFWGRRVSGSLVPGPWGEAISVYIGKEVLLARPGRPGDAQDEWPVSLLSRASADELAEQASDGAPRDSRRFRMLIELDGCEPHEEDTWDGRRLRVGGALLKVMGPIPRCVVTTQDPDTGIKDFDTLRAIANHRGRGASGTLDFGVYGTVLEPGSARVGDAASLD
ncbi:MAG: MOSC domain-containing protein [Actinomycetota bacterium]|nr:MOSC domain-containing protein [Actinomycetota bacterium]